MSFSKYLLLISETEISIPRWLNLVPKLVQNSWQKFVKMSSEIVLIFGQKKPPDFCWQASVTVAIVIWGRVRDMESSVLSQLHKKCEMKSRNAKTNFSAFMANSYKDMKTDGYNMQIWWWIDWIVERAIGAKRRVW